MIWVWGAVSPHETGLSATLISYTPQVECETNLRKGIKMANFCSLSARKSFINQQDCGPILVTSGHRKLTKSVALVCPPIQCPLAYETARRLKSAEKPLPDLTTAVAGGMKSGQILSLQHGNEFSHPSFEIHPRPRRSIRSTNYHETYKGITVSTGLKSNPGLQDIQAENKFSPSRRKGPRICDEYVQNISNYVENLVDRSGLDVTRPSSPTFPGP